jgi:hypothetical protein
MSSEKKEELIAKLFQKQIVADRRISGITEQFKKSIDEQSEKLEELINNEYENYIYDNFNPQKMTEVFFFNYFSINPVLEGIKFDYLQKNGRRFSRGIEECFGLFLVNRSIVYIVEVKYCLNRRDIDGFLTRKYPIFLKLYPEYQDFEIRTAFASFSIEDSILQYAKSKGITILQKIGDTIETITA